MEDFAQLIDFRGGKFIAVYDGHGGDETARLATQRLYKIFGQLLDGGATPEEAMRLSFLRFNTEALAVPWNVSGASATVVFLKDGKAVVGNVGDSEAIVVTEGGHRVLTKVHHLADQKERQRVLAAGGRQAGNYVYISAGGNELRMLNMTRSLGDPSFKSNGVIADPSITTYNVGPRDEFLVVASDGVWNYVPSKSYVADRIRSAATTRGAIDALVKDIKRAGLVATHKKESAAEWFERARSGGAPATVWEDVTDNISIVVVPLQQGGSKPSYTTKSFKK